MFDAETEAYCPSCGKFTKLGIEEPRPPLPTDTNNQGYLLGDLICEECSWIHTTYRQKVSR